MNQVNWRWIVDIKGLIADVKAKILENKEKIKKNKQLPYLVSNVVEILDLPPEEEEDGATQDADAHRQGSSVVIKTSTRNVNINSFTHPLRLSFSLLLD
jgi:ATP-dependent 26S proteasome regulatory subunit